MKRDDYLKDANHYLTEQPDYDPHEARQLAKMILVSGIQRTISEPFKIAEELGIDITDEYLMGFIQEQLQDIAQINIKNIDRMP